MSLKLYTTSYCFIAVVSPSYFIMNLLLFTNIILSTLVRTMESVMSAILLEIYINKNNVKKVNEGIDYIYNSSNHIH